MRPIDKAAADLTWYFSVGVSAFERSPAGAMLERAKQLAPPERAPLPRFQRRPEPEAITAQPTAETRPHASVEIDEALLARYGDLSRRMLRLRERDPIMARALGLAFGDRGAQWASHPRGRVVALFSLTPAGQRLLRRARRSSQLTDAELVNVEVTLAGVSKPEPLRKALVMTATTQAAGLLAEALKAWMGVV